MRFDDEAYIMNAVERYSDMIVRIAFQHTRRKSDAEDIAQEVFLALIKGERIRDEAHLKAWLIRVTINKCYNYLKSAKRTTAEPEKNDYALDGVQNEVLDALRCLEPKDRNILYLFYFEGYTAREIGETLFIRESAVNMRLSRARKSLKDLLEDNG